MSDRMNSHNGDSQMVDLYADMFELAPVSLWLEDFSELKAQFEQWRAQGIVDLRTHLKAVPECIGQCARKIRVVRVNQRTLSLYGARDQQELTDNLPRLFRDDMLDAYVDELAQLWDGHLRLSSQTVNYTLAGERRVMLLNASVLPGHEDTWCRVLVALEDVTARERTERHARSLFEHSPVSMWVTDFSGVCQLIDDLRAQGVVDLPRQLHDEPALLERCIRAVRIVSVNWRTLALFGAPSQQVLIEQIDRVFRSEMHAALADLFIDLSRGGLFHEREALTYSLGGAPVHVVVQFSVLPGHEPRWDQLLVSMTDITARKQAEAEVAYLSTHCALTGLYNRVFFRRELARLDGLCEGPVTLLVIDLNGLKTVNDRDGHPAGDALLQAAGRLLEGAIEAPMTVSRIGGDEFAVLMPGQDEAAGARLVAALGRATATRGEQADTPSLSIGSATRQPGESMEAIFQRADLLMYEAKRAFYETRDGDRRAY